MLPSVARILTLMPAKSDNHVSEAGLTRRTRKGFLWAFTGTGLQNVIQMVVLVVLARFVGAEEFGLINLALVIVSFSTLFASIGVGPAIIQRKEIQTVDLQVSFFISSMLGVVVAATLWLSSDLLADFFKMPQLAAVLGILALVFPLNGVSIVSEALLQRELKFRQLSLSQIVSYTAGYGIVGITLGVYGYGIWALLTAHLVQTAIRFTMLIAAQPPRFLREKTSGHVQAAKSLLKFGGGATIDSLSNYLAVQSDNLIIGRGLGAAALGLYGRAYQLAVLPATLLGQVLDKVLFSSMSKLQDDLQQLKASYIRSISYTSLLVAPISVICYLLASEIVAVVLGSGWTEVVIPFQILCIGMLFRTTYKISNSLVLARGYVYKRASRQVLYVLFVISGAVIGMRWGLSGAAYGVLIAISLHYFNMLYLCKTILSCTWRELGKAHLPALLGSAWMLIGLYAVTEAIRPLGWVSFVNLVVSGIFAIVWFAVVVLLFPKVMVHTSRTALRSKMQQVLGKVRRKRQA
ncbi:polysaccharide transporter, PST family [Paenibacillus algorifonticola]|uniref:Polysaccharide transporter, PST family n=2 Tax=Paenibacillus algorifonticola TaxID=684063 RepID=A0A1I2H6F2_9BACL|nr:polysaccharide transporter, PST family [Paenibacillus algorifonticola]